MTENEVLSYLRSLPDTSVVTSSKGDGSPEVAWGDSFAYYRPADDAPDDERGFQPFVTVVTKNYPDFDTESDLDRDGVFRVNLSVGRTRFEELLGFPPLELEQRRNNIDFSAIDQFIPHPQYSTQGWISVINPSELEEELRNLMLEAHGRAVQRKHRSQ